MINSTIHIVVAGLVCFVCIALRTGYRIAFRCKIHAGCHRQWHTDDIWMALSVFPLLGRVLCIAWSDILLAHPGTSEAEIAKSVATANMLLVPGRIFYALFLWMEKLCLLELYLRICDGLPAYKRAGIKIRYALYLTFVGIILATLLECRPLKLAWNGDPAGAQCRKARANLIVMAACNMATDLALIILPLSFLRNAGLSFSRFIRLGALFTLGSLIIITTIVRLPLILRDNAQKIRSLWASIEIACACIVANAPFFHTVIIDIRPGGAHSTFSTASQDGVDLKSGSSRIGSDGEISLWHVERRMTKDSEESDVSRPWGLTQEHRFVKEFIPSPNPFDDQRGNSTRDVSLDSKKLVE